MAKYIDGLYPTYVTVQNCFVTKQGIHCGKFSTIRNNIIVSSVYDGGISASDGSAIENNTIIADNKNSDSYSAIRATNSEIRNNIVINATAGFDSSNNNRPYSSYGCINFDTSGNNVIVNNVLSIPQQYADENYSNNYFVGATLDNTFVNDGSEDAKYILLGTSLAIGAATHGGDCGAFGGATPYIISGLPNNFPHITEALVPAKPTDGKIVVKLKIENQYE